MRDKTDLEPLWLVHWGSTEATSELFRRHYPAMVRYAKTLTNDPTMADDLASEAFTRTLERVRIGAVPQTLRAYLTTAVRNGAVDEFRRTNPLSSLTTYEEDRGSVAHTTAPLDFTSGLVDRDQLRQAFSALSPRHRLVLWRTTVEGRDLADVGTELGINANAAAALAHRARAAFRRAYEGVERVAAVHSPGGCTQRASRAAHVVVGDGRD